MPLDTSYVRTLGDIYAQRNQALQGIAQSALGGAAQVGAAAIGRKKDATALQADLDRTQGNVQMETQQLIDELARIREARSESNKGPYESAMLEQAEAETTGKLRDIGKYQSELGAIGDIGFGNVYKVRMPERLQPIGSAASKGRVMDLQAQSELEKTIALSEGRKAADAARRQAQLEDDQRSEARKLAAEQRAADREAKKDARESGQKAEVDSRKSLTELANAADAIDTNFAMIESNKDVLPKVNTATVAAIQKAKGGKIDKLLAAGVQGFEGVSATDVPKISAVAQAIETITAPIRSDTFGAALSVSDRAMSSANLPAQGDSYDELVRKLKVQREIIARTMQRIEDQGRGAGAQFKGFESTFSKKTLPAWATVQTQAAPKVKAGFQEAPGQ